MLGDPGAAATEWRRAPGVRPLTLSPRQRADGDRGAHALAVSDGMGRVREPSLPLAPFAQRVPGKPDSPRATHCFPEGRLKESLQRVATAPGPGARRSRAQASHSGLLPLTFFFPLIYPPTLVHAASRASRLRGRKINSDKPICMGKNRNGLAATKPISRLARAEGTWRREQPRPTLQNDQPYTSTCPVQPISLPCKTTYPILRPALYNLPCRISPPYKTTYPTLNDPAYPRLHTAWARGGSLQQRTY